MEGGCGNVEVRNKVEKEKKKKEKDEKRIFGCFETFRHSFSFSLLLNQIISITNPPIPPKYLSLSLWMNTQTHTLPHSYLSYKSTTIHVLTRIQITPKLLIPLFQTTHSISLPPKTIISLVHPQNQSRPPFALIHLI